MSDERGAWSSRGYLPHFSGATLQAVTFRMADALPAEVLDRWRAQMKDAATTRDSMPARAFMRHHIQQWLDKGHGACHLRRQEIGSMVENALLHFDQCRYRLLAWVVMPNHVHAVLDLDGNHRLESVIHSWKTFTARRANALLRRTGPFWQREYFDRYIRNPKHLANEIAYAENNPVAAGLCSRPEDWPFGSARRRLSAPGGRRSGG